MQAIFEPIFHVSYLSLVLILGLIYFFNPKGSKYRRLHGLMAIILGFGDSFHLIPRIIALRTDGFEAHIVTLGFGKFVTSITMTAFYLILYHLWKMRFSIKDVKNLDWVMYSLALVRIVLCFFPQNEWFIAEPSILWGIIRNVPFAIMGIIMIFLLYRSGRQEGDKTAIAMSIAVTLSFGFYLPVVLWAQTNFWVGMLMIPKTLAYVWLVLLGNPPKAKV
jgi:hypothetical protein